MRSLGIDIGRHSIKVVEITASSQSYQITRAKVYPLNLKSNDLEVEFITALHEISRDFDTDNAKVVASIRQQFVSLRRLQFPFRERAKIQKSLAFELEDEIPLAIDKAVFDGKILNYQDKLSDVLAMACPVEEIEKNLELYNRAHIDPDVIAPEISAIANLYGKWYRSPTQQQEPGEPDKMVVVMGHTRSFVGLIHQQQLIWGRSLLWGGEKVAQAIARAFQVPMTESIKMMPQKSFLLMATDGASPDQIKMSNTVAESFEPFLQSLRLTLLLAATEQQLNIENIELVGGPSQIKNLGPFFTQQLEKTCNIVNPIDSFENTQIEPLMEIRETCHYALGLAIEGIKRPINPAVNFRQGELAKKNRSFDIFWEKWGYAAKLMVVAYFCYFAYGVTRESIAVGLEQKSNDVLIDQAGKIAKLKGGTATQSRIQSFIRQNQKKADTAKMFEKLSDINSPVQWVHDISQALPMNQGEDNFYEIKKFKVYNSTVNIQGVANSQKTISEIEAALKSLAVGGTVKNTNSNLAKTGNQKSLGFEFDVRRKTQ